jgi:hypothetical protein
MRLMFSAIAVGALAAGIAMPAQAETVGQVGAKTRLAVYVSATGPTIVTNYNVRRARRASKGIYCVLPAPAAKINISKAIPVATAATLGGNAAWIASPNMACLDNEFTVVTTITAGGGVDFSNLVSFTFVVP